MAIDRRAACAPRLLKALTENATDPPPLQPAAVLSSPPLSFFLSFFLLFFFPNTPTPRKKERRTLDNRSLLGFFSFPLSSPSLLFLLLPRSVSSCRGSALLRANHQGRPLLPLQKHRAQVRLRQAEEQRRKDGRKERSRTDRIEDRAKERKKRRGGGAERNGLGVGERGGHFPRLPGLLKVTERKNEKRNQSSSSRGQGNPFSSLAYRPKDYKHQLIGWWNGVGTALGPSYSWRLRKKYTDKHFYTYTYGRVFSCKDTSASTRLRVYVYLALSVYLPPPLDFSG